MLWLYEKHLSGVVSNLEYFPLTHQNENNIAYKCKANENLFRKEAILNCFQSENKTSNNK
jgi:hypothetical protein